MTMAIDVAKLRPNSLKKYRAIQQRFKELYDGQRIRVDDVYDILSREFFISEIRLTEIMRLDLPEKTPPADPNQLLMFSEEEE